MEINVEEIKKILTLEEVRHLKSLAIQKQMFELAAHARDHEKYLMTPEGQMWSTKEKIRIKVSKREDKLNRIFLSNK